MSSYAYLTHKGVFVDAGRFTDIDAARLRPIYAGYPRPADPGILRDAITAHAARSEAVAPPYSISAELLRQRRAEAALTK